MKETPLYIPPDNRTKGLTVWCDRCKTNVIEICKENGKSILECKNGHRHKFKIYKYVTKDRRITKTLKTREIEKAIVEAKEFLKEKKQVSQMEQVSLPDTHSFNVSVKKPEIINDVIASYIGWLGNENVPTHLQKERSVEHIKDNERAMILLVKTLIKAGFDPSTRKMSEINDNVIGIVYDELVRVRKYSIRSVNKHLSYYTSMSNWHIEENDPSIKNYFKRAIRKQEIHTPPLITGSEFDRLLKVITKENGVKKYNNKIKPSRNLYREYLVPAFKLGLFTGRRREELIQMKFNNIIEDANGNHLIKIEDLKVNNIQKRKTENEKKYIFIPVTEEVKTLLEELDWEKYKATDNYLLAPEIKVKRNRVMADSLSRGFSHYFDLLQTGEHKNFGVLRKTYITHLSMYMGGNAKLITGHSDNAVIEKHYINKEKIAQHAQGFNVFSTTDIRKQELEQLRTGIKEKSNTLEIN